MSASAICPGCSKPLPADAPRGFCPACLLGLLGPAVGQASSLPPGLPAPDHAAERSSASGKSPAPGSPQASRLTPHTSSIGDYELLEEIARGGMGVVFKARQHSLNRLVALKLLPAGTLAKPEAVKRFQAEASAAAALQHPNIVAIHEIGVQGDQHFIAMDLVDGPPLSRVISDLRYTIHDFRRVARWMRVIAEAVHYAHERGILHRDLKPSNILIGSNDQPRVTDFGLAKRVVGTRSTASDIPSPGGEGQGEGGSNSLAKITSAVELVPTDLTLSGQLLGSPNYMPPEQAAAQRGKASRRSDVYGLGATLYHLLTGRAPFQASSITEVLHQVATADPLAPRLLQPGVPADLETICLKCLEKEPSKRYATAQALADELGRFLHDEPIHARPVGRVEKAWRWCRRKPALATSLFAIIILLLIVTIGSPIAAYRINRERQRAEDNAANERRERYYASIAAADSHIRNGDIDVALNVLTNCPPELRHWEWGRLLFLCHQSINTTEMPRRAGDDNASWIINADGRRAVSARFIVGQPGSARLWDLQTGREMVKIGSGTNAVIAMAFSPDGLQVALAQQNGLVSILDAETSLERTKFETTSPVDQMQFNSDGTRLALTTLDRRSSLWDIGNGQRQLLTPAMEGLRAAALDPTGRVWATMDSAERISLRDPATGHSRLTMQGFADVNPLTVSKRPSLIFSPDGRRLLAHANLGLVKVWNVEDGRELAVIPTRVYDAAFSPDSQQVILFSGNKTAELWEMGRGRKVRTLHGHTAAINAIAFSPDGGRVLTSSADGLLKTWNASFGREVLTHPFYTDALAFHSDGRLLTTALDGLVRLWDIASGRELRSYWGNGNWPRSASFSPDRKRLVTGGADRLGRILEADSGRALLRLKGHASAIRAVAFSPDGRRVATGSADQTVRLWDADTGTELFTLRGHSDSVRRIVFTPDGKRLISVAQEPTARVWDAETGRQIFVLQGSSPLFALAVSRDGRYIATGSWGKTIYLWDGYSGQSLRQFTSRDQIQDLDFSPDGKRLLVAASHSMWYAAAFPTLEIWEVESGRQLLAFSEHTSVIFDAKFSPDGRRIASSSMRAVRVSESFPWEESAYPDPPANPSPRSSRREEALTSISQRSTLNAQPTNQSLVTSAATPLLERIKAYAESYGRERLAAESSRRSDEADTAPTNTPPVRLVTSAATYSPRFPRDAWPARQSKQSTNLIDLSTHYNALLDVPWRLVLIETDYDQDLSKLPTGTVTHSNVTFDVRGIIRLDAAERLIPYEGPLNHFTNAARNIPVHAPFRRFHLLHGAEGIVPDGTVIVRYVLHYADGVEREIPVEYGRDVRDWREADDRSQSARDRGIVVWRGTAGPAKQGNPLRIYLTAFDNPRPDVEVKSIDLISTLTPCAPFLIALTIEP